MAPASRVRSASKKSAQRNDGLAFRLDPAVRARVYRLSVEVDPTASKAYRGSVTIACELSAARSQIELHAADLQVQRVRAAGAEVRYELHPERESLAVFAPARFPPGALELEITFSGQLRSDLRGLYAASSGERQYAFTQLEAADARRFFPCFDEPDQKARFQLSVRTARKNAVFSNNPVERVEEHESGDKTVHFSQTPLLSSYLVALAVGDLVGSAPVYAGAVPIRLVHVPGSEAITSFALETARECLLRLSAYFALPYPYEKLDLVAVPDFEIGAMENAGAVFFRETLLLVDESSISLPERKRAAEVICHELAHMWYGNLVTMRWWDDLWLNEAFATWMAFEIVAKWRPEWKMWNDFDHARNSALQLDALASTHAIYTEVRTPAEATQNFDVITYEKGAAVVRMLERYLGPNTFRRGVRRYIKRHRESNTAAQDLWVALSEAADQDVAAVVRPFIEQPGFPLVRVSRAGSQLRLQQEPFSARGPQLAKTKNKVRWPVPWVGRVGVGRKTKLVKHLLTKDSARIALGPSQFVYGNADEGGFFRPLHDRRDLADLIPALPRLSASERLGFVQHQWALTRAGYAELGDFLPLLAALRDESDPDVLRALAQPCDHLVDDLSLPGGAAARISTQRYIASVFGPALEALGWAAADGGGGGGSNDDEQRLRRVELVQVVALIAEDPAATAHAEQLCQQYLRDRRSLDPNLVVPVLAVGARHADAARLASLLHASEHDDTPQERRRFRLALGDVRDPELARQVMATCLTPRIPTQDVAFVMSRLLRNPAVQMLAFEFLQERWSALRERVPAMLMSRLIEATPALRSEAQRKALLAFFKKNPLPTATRALRQADERFRLDAAFRKRAWPALKKFLRDPPG
jgi:puromycin-sensitive aminopeptidase